MGWYSAEELARWCGGVWHGDVPDRVTGITQDTRKLLPGELYVAIRGDVHDGHRFLIAALEGGASGALIDSVGVRDVPVGLPYLVVPDTVDALAGLARGYRRALGMRVVGITGSVGKTTVKDLLASMLSAAWPTARTLGNWNNQIGLPLSVLASDRDSRAGVFEMGMNVPGEIAFLAEIAEPVFAVMTPIGPVHMEAFGTERAIAEEKAELLAALPEDGHAVVWQEEPHIGLFRRRATVPLTTVSLGSGADYNVAPVNGADVRVREGRSGESMVLPCPLPGEHNRLNIVLAVAAARLLGVGWSDIEAGLSAFKPAPMRWERIHVGGANVVNDAYNANPMSMTAALRLFSEEPCLGKRWLVLGGMFELGEMTDNAHERLGQEVADGPWSGLVTVGRLGAQIAAGARDAGFAAARITEVSTPEAAADVLAGYLEHGDGVLLKASRGVHLEHVLTRLLERSVGRLRKRGER